MNARLLFPELSFQTSRSGGKGGQNVNKVESKVELRFDVLNSKILSPEEKQLVLSRLRNKISSEGILTLYHQTERSQLANKELVIEKFYQLITSALAREKQRKPTAPTLGSILKKRRDKTARAKVKASRQKPGFD